MTIIFGFLLPVLMWFIELALKITLKAYQTYQMQAGKDPAKSSVMDKLNKAKNSNAGKAAQMAIKAAQMAIKLAIKAIKLLIDVIKGTIQVISFFVSMGVVGIVLLLLILVAVMAGAIVVLMMAREEAMGDLQAGGSVSVNGTVTSTGDMINTDKFFWVGDSRTVGMGLYVYGQTSDGHGGGDTGMFTDSFCARVSRDINWFLTEGDDGFGANMTEQREKIYALKGYNVVFNFGVNGFEGSNDVNFYKSLPADFLANNNVFFMSVNPINESKVSNFTNQDIKDYNEAVKAALPEGVTYIDTYSELEAEINSADSKWIDGDGLHNTAEGYAEINRLVLEKVKALIGNGTPAQTEDATEETTEATEEEKENE